MGKSKVSFILLVFFAFAFLALSFILMWYPEMKVAKRLIVSGTILTFVVTTLSFCVNKRVSYLNKYSLPIAILAGLLVYFSYDTYLGKELQLYASNGVLLSFNIFFMLIKVVNSEIREDTAKEQQEHQKEKEYLEQIIKEKQEKNKEKEENWELRKKLYELSHQGINQKKGDKD